jgi:hypothetical protein
MTAEQRDRSSERSMPADEDDQLLTADAAESQPPVPGVPSDNTTLVAVLDGIAGEGYDGDFFVTGDGLLHCAQCGVDLDPADFDVDAIRRMEGASDPDDLVAVVAARCPACQAQGTAVVGVGPTASAEDHDVTTALREASRPD